MSKNSPGGDSSLGPEQGDECERQLQLRPQALLLVGGDTPQRRPPQPLQWHTPACQADC